MPYSAVTHPLPAFEPRRRTGFDAGRAQDFGITHLDQRRSGCVLGVSSRYLDGAKFIACSAAGSHVGKGASEWAAEYIPLASCQPL